VPTRWEEEKEVRDWLDRNTDWGGWCEQTRVSYTDLFKNRVLTGSTACALIAQITLSLPFTPNLNFFFCAFALPRPLARTALYDCRVLRARARFQVYIGDFHPAPIELTAR
jgi:hypothetical protein